MSSPENREINSLIDSAFEGVDVAEIDRQFDEQVVLFNFGTLTNLINLVDFPQMEEEGLNYRKGSMYIDPLGRILAVGAYHIVDPEVIYADGVQELDLYVFFAEGQQQLDFDLPQGGPLTERAEVNLEASFERCNSFRPTS